MSEKRQCSHMMRKGSGWNRYDVPCTNSAKVERDGKPYCGTHDPVAVKARDERRSAKSREAWLEQKAAWRVSNASPALLAACKAALEHLMSDDDNFCNACDHLIIEEFAQSHYSNCPVPALKAAIAQAEGGAE